MAQDAPLIVERKEGMRPGTRILILNGPLTLRNMFDLQTDLRTQPCPELSILDLTGVPYMDSAGMGLIVNHFTQCQSAGKKMVAVGVCSRVLELFKITKVDSVVPRAETTEAAEAGVLC
jgi:anti-sigma B factor antagonist